eukprot:gene14992-17189_t
MDFFNEPDNIWVASSDGNLAEVKKLIEGGVGVNSQDEYGYSPLHAAASYGEMVVLEYLLSVGGDVSLRDEDGDTPLLVCEKPDIFQRLVAAGADPHVKNSEGKGIVEKAVEEDAEELINYLVESGFITDPNFKYVPGEAAEMANFMDMLEPVEEGAEGGEDGSDDDAEDMNAEST